MEAPKFRVGQKVLVTEKKFSMDDPTAPVMHQSLTSAHIMAISYLTANKEIYNEDGSKKDGEFELDFESYMYHLDNRAIQREANIRLATEEEVLWYFTPIGADAK